MSTVCKVCESDDADFSQKDLGRIYLQHEIFGRVALFKFVFPNIEDRWNKKKNCCMQCP